MSKPFQNKCDMIFCHDKNSYHLKKNVNNDEKDKKVIMYLDRLSYGRGQKTLTVLFRNHSTIT